MRSVRALAVLAVLVLAGCGSSSPKVAHPAGTTPQVGGAKPPVAGSAKN